MTISKKLFQKFIDNNGLDTISLLNCEDFMTIEDAFKKLGCFSILWGDLRDYAGCDDKYTLELNGENNWDLIDPSGEVEIGNIYSDIDAQTILEESNENLI